MYLLYSVLLGFGAVVTSPYWLVMGLRQHKYLSNFAQRLSLWLPRLPAAAERPLWIHAVSVGEVLAAKPLFRKLREAHPDLPVVVSTVTLTGQALARKELSASAGIFYFPFDWDFCVRRFLDRVRPGAVLLLETELWPNFLRNCARRSIPVLLVNGRLSDSSLRRYALVRGFIAATLGRLTGIGAQTAEDRRRFLQLGAADALVAVTGNLKFDLAAPEVDPCDPVLRSARWALGLDDDSPVVVVGSSMKGEEVLFLDAFSTIKAHVPTARLILAPRHPERFDEVSALLSASPFRSCRRSRLPGDAQPAGDILLLDTIGELRRLYSLGSVAVIGGSFLPFGGHNPLEPAGLGKAIVFGPEMANFREVARLLLQDRAACQCSPEVLAETLVHLLKDRRARESLGQRAASVFQKHQGATETTYRMLAPCLAGCGSAGPNPGGGQTAAGPPEVQAPALQQ